MATVSRRRSILARIAHQMHWRTLNNIYIYINVINILMFFIMRFLFFEVWCIAELAVIFSGMIPGGSYEDPCIESWGKYIRVLICIFSKLNFLFVNMLFL